MAAPTTSAVTCPKCEKKFKPKGEVQGKKIKCPFCSHPFVVPAAKDAKSAKEPRDAIKAGKPKAAEAKTKPAEEKPAEEKPAAPAAPAAPPPAEGKKTDAELGLEADPDPYGVKTQTLARLCPVCTKEMEDDNAIICLYCGYNTLTRQAGKVEKTIGITSQQHLIYLLPALGTAVFCCCAILFLLYFCLIYPYHVSNTFLEFTDHESVRLGLILSFLAIIWSGGMFCFKKFIENPKPDEVKLE